MAAAINADNGVVSGSAGLKSSADATGVLVLQTNGTTAVTIDTSQNVGVGVTPSAWYYPAVSLANGSFYSRPDPSSGIAANAYSSTSGGGWKYIATAAATRYEQSAGTHAWSTAASGTAGNAITFTQAMTLDSSGNLGVGTTSPSYRLDVSGFDAAVRINSSVAGGNCGLRFLNGTGNNASILFGDTDAADVGFIQYVHSDNSLRINVNAAERARIDSAGRFLIGRTSSSFLSTWGVMAVGQSAAIVGPPDSNAIFCANAYYDGAWKRVNAGVANILELTAGSSYIQFFTSASSTAGSSISFTSGPYIANGGTTWTNGSDARLKNITGEIQNGLAKVMTLRAAEFTWKHDADNKPCVGLIAQDVQAVLPEAIDESSYIRDDETKYLGVNYDQTIPLLVAAIQELKAEFDAYKASHP